MENTKKGFIVSVVAVIVLVVLIIGVSYAMFSFSGAGTKTNVINTGNVDINFVSRTVMELINQYPMTDAEGLGSSNVMEFDVTANISGVINIKYELGLDEIVEGNNKLKSDKVKIAMFKNDVQVIGNNDGVRISEFANKSGDFIDSNYLEVGGNFESLNGSTVYKAKDSYKIIAWISDDFEFATNDSSPDDLTHSSQAVQETYKFKVRVEARQVV